MASVTLSLSDEFKDQLKHFSWINWSEVAREEMLKKVIFEEYIKTGTLSDDAWEFCDSIDWHPVDELPLKEEFIRKMEAIKKEKSIKLKSISEIFKNVK